MKLSNDCKGNRKKRLRWGHIRCQPLTLHLSRPLYGATLLNFNIDAR
jgi:hypothetical protein